MKLICMAHMGEAQAFIQGLNLSKTSESVFENDTTTLLLTGEGPFEAASKCAYLLGKKPFTEIYNFGISGSLKNDLQKDSIHEIRQSYLFLNSPQFKSYPLSSSGLDCITSFERALSTHDAEKLRGFASLVDRELWGLGLAAKEAKIPLRSFKLISDIVGEAPICDLVLEKSLVWSKMLFDYYCGLQSPITTSAKELEVDGFYFTFSSEHQLRTLLSKTKLDLKDLPLDDFRSLTKNPKDRVRHLIQFLEEKIDPLKAKIRSQITFWKKPFEKQQIRIETDPQWESSNVKISFEVQNDEELKQRLQTLQDLTLTPYQDVLAGKIHVE